MSIQELSARIKGFFGNTDVLLSTLIITVALASYGLGRYSVWEGNSASSVTTSTPLEPAVVLVPPAAAPTSTAATPAVGAAAGAYVASKSGTKYHLPWCGSAKQIKEENKIWFATKEEAEKAGYTPAANCPGI